MESKVRGGFRKTYFNGNGLYYNDKLLIVNQNTADTVYCSSTMHQSYFRIKKTPYYMIINYLQ